MFKLEEFMGRRVLKSSLIDNDDKVIAFFTTRDLPLKYAEREDLKDEIEANKKLVCKGLNIPPENLFIPQQTHSDNVVIINKIMADSAKVEELKSLKVENNNIAFQPFNHSAVQLANTDALITNLPNTAIALNFADCVPIVFYDPKKKVVASAHAGWRGTVARIGVKTVDKMVENFGCSPENIIALIGPAIGKCCFEAGEEVLEQIKESVDYNFQDAISDKFADLKQINKIQLLARGLKKIDVCEYCTSCQNELFFSYRKEKGNTARHSTVIMLK